MRVLTLTPFYPTASDDSTGCFIAEPIRALKRLGVESQVVAAGPFYRARDSSSPATPAEWVRYAAFPGGAGLASAGVFLASALISKVREWHRRQPIDLIHAHAALPCGQAAARLSRELGIPFAVTVHGLDAFFTEQVHGPAGWWRKRVAEAVYRSAARVICISHKVAERIMRGAAAIGNTAVIYNGVDPQRFQPPHEGSQGPIVLSVGNLIPIKGHELLLRAFANVGQRQPHVTCEIIGDGPEQFRLSGLVRELNIADRVRFLGRQSRKQVAEAMRRCSVFVLPSRYEGLGCVYLEAMAAQKPAIACHGQGIEEIIRHRANGWLVPTGDAQALTDAISCLIEDQELRQQIGAAARQTILQSFTLAHQAARLAQVYRECMA